jgi:chromosome segregation ATPase
VEQAGVEALISRRRNSGVGATEQTRQEVSKLEDKLAALNAQQKSVETELDRWTNALHDFSKSVELQGKQDELKALQESADRVARELEMQKVERKASQRILFLERAEP